MDNNIETQKHIRKIYIDKAINLLKFCIGIFIFSGLTYLIGIFAYNSFDFGLILEIISFIFVVLALNNIKQDNLSSGKKNTIIAMIPVGWLVIYDFIILLANSGEVLVEIISYFLSFDQFFYCLEPYLFDITLIISIVLLYKTYSSLCLADGSKKSSNYIDSFYDKL